MFAPIETICFSIHASAKEATVFICEGYLDCFFQSTPPRRRRRLNILFTLLTMFFNPRLREGGDCCSTVPFHIFAIFQSTPPRRRRLLLYSMRFSYFLFQSTPPRRRRRKFSGTELCFGIFSIHASAKEATKC